MILRQLVHRFKVANAADRVILFKSQIKALVAWGGEVTVIFIGPVETEKATCLKRGTNTLKQVFDVRP